MKSGAPEKSATLNARKSAAHLLRKTAHNHNGCSPHGADSHIARLHPPEARTAYASSPLTHDQDSGRRIGNTVFGGRIYRREIISRVNRNW